MREVVYVEFRKLTSERKNDLEMRFLGARYSRLKGTGFLPSELTSSEYEDLRHLIVGGWIAAMSPHLRPSYMESYVSVNATKVTDYTEYTSSIKTEDPIFLISVMTPNFWQANEFLQHVRSVYPRSCTIVGGVHPTWMPLESMAILAPDYLVVGECDDFIKDLVDAAAERQAFSHEAVINRDEVRSQIPKPFKASLGNIRWDWKMHNLYSQGWNRVIPNYVGSRSCLYRCHFCGIVHQKHSEVPSNFLIEQTTALLQEHDRVWIHWESPLCLQDEGINREFFEHIRGLPIHLSGQHVVEEPTPARLELYELAFEAGFDNCYLGIETMQDHLRRNLAKKSKAAVIEPCLEAMSGAGISVNAGYILGIPGQTVDDIKRDIETAVWFIRKGILAVCLPQYMEIYPGTHYWTNAEKFGIELDTSPEGWATVAAGLNHRTKELSRDEIWFWFEEFLRTVIPEIENASPYTKDRAKATASMRAEAGLVSSKEQARENRFKLQILG